MPSTRRTRFASTVVFPPAADLPLSRRPASSSLVWAAEVLLVEAVLPVVPLVVVEELLPVEVVEEVLPVVEVPLLVVVAVVPLVVLLLLAVEVVVEVLLLPRLLLLPSPSAEPSIPTILWSLMS